MIMVLSVAFSYSQNATIDKTMGYDDVLIEYTGDATDTIGATDSTWTYTLKKKTDTRNYLSTEIHLDSIGGTADTVFVIRQYKKFSFGTYANLDTVIWAGSADTIIKIVDGTARHNWYWRYLVKGSTSSFNVGVDYLGVEFLK